MYESCVWVNHTEIRCMFCIGFFLLVAALSARSLWTSLRGGEQDLAWMSAAYFAVASLLIVLFWFLSQEP